MNDKYLQAIQDALPSDRYSLDSKALDKASRDRFNLSPILKETLPLTQADIVVWPQSTAEIQTLLEIAYVHDVPVTPRGLGTGNYGQAVPFHHGISLDMSKFRQIFEVGTDYVRAAAGARIFQLEREANKKGLELGLMPSTVGSSIGGFLGGGSGGAGSISNGWIWDGFTRELTVVPCIENPRALTFSGADCRPFLHSYGTTGIIGEVEVLLQPKPVRIGIYASFSTTEAATELGLKLMNLEPRPRLVSVDSPEVSNILSTSEAATVKDQANLRALIAQETAEQASALIRAHGGSIVETRENADAVQLSMAFNHVAERVLEEVNGYIHLQVSGPGMPEIKSKVHRELPGLYVHFDGFQINGVPNFVGLMFIPRPSVTEDLKTTFEILAQHGVNVNNPHQWGLHRNLDIYRPVAKKYDPKGLLNPGKLPD